MQNRIKFHYVRQGMRQMTVATEVDEAGDELAMGFAFCSPEDQHMFCKETGRRLAMERMKSDDQSFHAKFTGHSANDVAAYFNGHGNCINKPMCFRHGMLANVPQTKGLTYLIKA